MQVQGAALCSPAHYDRRVLALQRTQSSLWTQQAGSLLGTPSAMSEGVPRPWDSRITPAHAGSTAHGRWPGTALSNHPRACGEHIALGHEGRKCVGSPPRMRGARSQPLVEVSHRRTTPAHAGSTLSARAPCRRGADHPPRMRGALELADSHPYLDTFPGSPPRMRGAHQDHGDPVEGCRITPAHAGSTPGAARGPERRPDHPRACGEHSPEEFGSTLARGSPRACGEHAEGCGPTQESSGSPPRMRGALLAPRSRLALRRITPAHAGSTPSHPPTATLALDHPRACGEHRHAGAQVGAVIGSPPRMRGAPDQRDQPPHRPRITPAHAGSTSRPMSTAESAADHPRACGEHSRPSSTQGHTAGSPPRMRGALCRLGHAQP